MTKLQTLEAEIHTLSVEEQRALFSKFPNVVTPVDEDFFELTDEELAELDRRMKDDTETFTMEEVFGPLREKYGLRDLA